MRRRQISRRLHSGRQIPRLDPTKHEKLKSSSLSARIKYILNPILYNKTELLLMQSTLSFFSTLEKSIKTLKIFENHLKGFLELFFLHSFTKKIYFFLRGQYYQHKKFFLKALGIFISLRRPPSIFVSKYYCY
jgi:hypothetical protein